MSNAGPAVTVYSTSGLLTALKVASAGETIYLASGVYAAVNISNINGNGVTIAAAKSGPPAILQGLSVSNSSGLSFQGLELSAAGSKAAYAFTVASCSNIAFSNMNVHGSLDNDPGDDTNGFYIHGSSNVSITGSTFQQLANAVTELNNTDVTISNNNFHDIRSDGIDNGGSSYVSITGNTFTNFDPASSAQHPDAIQFWTTNTTSSAHDINIAGNTIEVGTGGQTQGIFLNDETGQLPYQNVSISNNIVEGELWNGIVVNHANSVTVIGNTVLEGAVRAANADNTAATGIANSSWISIQDSSNVALGGNNADSFNLKNDSDLVQTNVNALEGVAQLAVVHSAVSATLGNMSETLVLTGSAKISGGAGVVGSTVIGNNAGDRLYDGAGSNTLIGGTGSDVFISRSGSDTMTGGGGNDAFDVSNTIVHDTITDFGHKGSYDVLNISSFTNAGMAPTLTNEGGNVVISFSHSAATITLLGVQADSLIAVTGGYAHKG